MSVIAIIPARMASSRLPGKPLKKIHGLSMIEHIRRRVSLCTSIDKVIVATCDNIIYDEVMNNGGNVVMTSEKHDNCIDRVAEASSKFNAEIILNVQGDMPLVDPNSLVLMIKPLLKNKKIYFTDMIKPINDNDKDNPNIVKVVTDLTGNAIYYSREAIPYEKKITKKFQKYFMQVGITAFRKKYLLFFSKLNKTPLEKQESIDMLRLLENNYKIKTIISSSEAIGVDTYDDLEKAKKLMLNNKYYLKY